MNQRAIFVQRNICILFDRLKYVTPEATYTYINKLLFKLKKSDKRNTRKGKNKVTMAQIIDRWSKLAQSSYDFGTNCSVCTFSPISFSFSSEPPVLLVQCICVLCVHVLTFTSDKRYIHTYLHT